ncbi:uncharacterized protein KY384_002800 [Bacidia gigantensis]|uniref:uncharacterized protein n=1 Tax=Bacidia gigantensis TaxID=2732470 RepID=UPI001D053811|nr:uncharacterized protein KY384_002800 [Bacidia gigantensis]KAG8532922.1 hypothetical protein KY384_002800 [Bacidia gigantensis]
MNAVREKVDEGLPRKSTQQERKIAEDEAVKGFSVGRIDSKSIGNQNASTGAASDQPGQNRPGQGHDLSLILDDKLVTIKDQIQMYTTNQLLSYPLVSPVIETSLGGLPPLLIMVGGGEILRDEQIYLAHKAANPVKYPPGDAFLEDVPNAKEILEKYRPTDVQLQVWDDLCHVGPTLSFTRPAKFMYRSIAQFGAWSLAKAQKTEIDIQDDDDMSIISSGSDTDGEDSLKKPSQTKTTMKNGVAQGGTLASDQVGKAGDQLPPFKNHMIRQRVDRHGNIFPLDPASSLPALNVPANDICVIKSGPAKAKWDGKYAREKRKVQKQRAKEMAEGFQTFDEDDVPPPSALAGRRGLKMQVAEQKNKRSWGMSLWSRWGSSHDENTIEREEKADKEVEKAAVSEDKTSNTNPTRPSTSRSKSRRRTVTYTAQDDVDEKMGLKELRQKQQETNDVPTITTTSTEPVVNAADQPRPSAGGKAFPFKLGTQLLDDGRNASTLTLMSQAPVGTPKGDEKGKQLGENMPLGAGVEDRRMTMEDAGGVLHKGPAPPPAPPPAATSTPVENDPSQAKGVDIDNSPAAAAAEDRRMTLEDATGVLHHGAAPPSPPQQAPSQPAPSHISSSPPTSSPVMNEQAPPRRMTLEDSSGVLHQGPAPAPAPSPPSRPAVEQEGAGEVGDGDGEGSGETTPIAEAVGGRRMTVEDASGVLHKTAEAVERPGLERFETARED